MELQAKGVNYLSRTGYLCKKRSQFSCYSKWHLTLEQILAGMLPHLFAGPAMHPNYERNSFIAGENLFGCESFPSSRVAGMLHVQNMVFYTFTCQTNIRLLLHDVSASHDADTALRRGPVFAGRIPPFIFLKTLRNRYICSPFRSLTITVALARICHWSPLRDKSGESFTKHPGPRDVDWPGGLGSPQWGRCV